MGRYISTEEVRKGAGIGSVSVITDAEIGEEIEGVEALIDEHCHTTFTYMPFSETLEGTDSRELVLKTLYPRSFTLIPPDLVMESFRDSGVLTFNTAVSKGKFYTVEGLAGFSAEPPKAIVSAARIASQEAVRIRLQTGLNTFSTTEVRSEYGQFSEPNWSGRFGFSGNSTVMRVLKSYRQRSRRGVGLGR